ncbi:DNA primase [Pelagibacteraceae bacterium GOM-A5]|nr:DNA primase [Pelagibacteraceae bacterium GOM-A5]
MKYPKEYLDEIKTRLKVSTVVSKTVKLKKRGKEFVGLSPFKTEKTPSFTVNDEKEFYHCFSTSEHGNIFDFVMKTQNLRFGDAVKMLSNLAGMQPYTFSKQDEERENKWKLYKSICNNFSEFYKNELFKNENSIKAKNYLKARGLSGVDVKNFNLGFVTEDLDFYEKLKKDFDEETIKDTGLFYFDEKKKKYISRFRNRIIFPINNISGNVIGFGGRIVEDNKNLAKYINSPETPFFKKGSNLYNLDKARKLSNKLEDVYLVEGYMDVIGLSRNGIENTVANLGTALTSKQIQILNQFYNHIIICFDGDASGYKAALRAAENIINELKPDKKISFLILENNLDPDNYVNKFGKDKFLEISVQKSIPIHKFIFEHYINLTTDSPSSKAIFEKKLREIAYNIKDSFVKKYTLEYFLEKVSELTPNINSKFTKNYKKFPKSLATTKNYYNETKSLKSYEIKEFSFLYILLVKPKLIHENLHLIDNVKLYSEENKQLFAEILNQSDNLINFDVQKLNIDKNLVKRVFNYASVKHIIMKNLKDDEKILEIFIEIIQDLKNYELEQRISELESKFSKDMSESTFNELKELKKQQKIN